MSITGLHHISTPDDDPSLGPAQKPAAGSKLSAWWIYLVAFSYFTIVTVAFFISKIDTHDFFTQAAVVLGGVGLYHVQPPGGGKAA